jgi:hypothetical protein
MTLTIELPKAVEDRLAVRAREAGLDLATYVARLLRAESIHPTLEQRLASVREAFARSGMTDDEVAEQYETEKHAEREARRGVKFAE